MSTFSVFVVYSSAVGSIKRAAMWNVSVLVSESLYLHIYLLIFQEKDKDASLELEINYLQ